MSHKIVVGYDGSASARHAVSFAVEQAKALGASIVITHILEWSPYSFLTPTELEERHKRREEELTRAKQALIEPLLKNIESKGVEVIVELKYGHIAETLSSVAEKHHAKQIIIGRNGHSNLSSRLFGSVAGTLAQASPVPVTITP